MKIEEIIDIEDFISYKKSDLKIVDNYINDDCVIAYYKCNMGCIIIIKTKQTYVGFYYLISGISNFYYNNSQRISITQALNMMKDNIIIVDEDELNTAKRKEMLKRL